MKNADIQATEFGAVEDDSTYDYFDSVRGLTKRELFAMHAMQSLIPVYWGDDDSINEHESGASLVKCMMETAVEHADALLKELDK